MTMRAPLVLLMLCLALTGCSRSTLDGCVDAPFKTCIANVSLIVSDDSPETTSKEIARQTVSGVLNGDISIEGHFRDAPSHAVSISIMVYKDTVLMVSVQTQHDDAIAETDAQYDRTDLSRVFQVLTGGKCENGEPLDKQSVYRFFQTKIKPARKRAPEPPHETAEHEMKTPPIPFCGRKLSYAYTWGVQPDTIRAENPTGAYTLQFFSLISSGAGFH
ncbi:MAG TPA: hypothetical protein VGG10_18705 [Rhizomicrobium sp.]|jgi:hypothetical protein